MHFHGRLSSFTPPKASHTTVQPLFIHSKPHKHTFIFIFIFKRGESDSVTHPNSTILRSRSLNGHYREKRIGRKSPVSSDFFFRSGVTCSNISWNVFVKMLKGFDGYVLFVGCFYSVFVGWVDWVVCWFWFVWCGVNLLWCYSVWFLCL